MEGPAAKERTLWPALVAAAVLLLTAPQAFASRTASTRPELLTGPALEQPVAAEALAPAYVPQGFELHASTDSHPRHLALFHDLTPPPASVRGEKLASGVASWEPRPNLQRIQAVVAETWWVREHLGAIDSPNLYQAFGLDPQNNTDPLGLRKATILDIRDRSKLLEERARQIAEYRRSGTLINQEHATGRDVYAFVEAWDKTLASYDKSIEEAGENDLVERFSGSFVSSNGFWGTRGFMATEFRVADPGRDVREEFVATALALGPTAVAVAGMPYAFPGGAAIVEQQAMQPGVGAPPMNLANTRVPGNTGPSQLNPPGAINEIPPGSAGGSGAGQRIPSWLRDRWFPSGETPPTCSYCRTNSASALDHVHARINNGDLTPGNITPACVHCNSSKGPRIAPITPPPNYTGEWPPPWWPQPMKDWWSESYGAAP